MQPKNRGLEIINLKDMTDKSLGSNTYLIRFSGDELK